MNFFSQLVRTVYVYARDYTFARTVYIRMQVTNSQHQREREIYNMGEYRYHYLASSAGKGMDSWRGRSIEILI
jgi:hypothetical protein